MSNSIRHQVAATPLDLSRGITKQSLAQSTKTAKKAGQSYLLLYVKETFGYDSLTSIADSDVTAEFFDLYSCWLVSQLKTDSKQGLKQGTILQYLSAARSSLLELKPTLPLWKEDKWYSDIRSSVETFTSRNAIARGEAIADKAEPVGRRLLMVICRHFARSTDTAATAKRAGIIANRMACGRSGELANCTWRLSRWDDENCCLEWLWNDQKNSKQKIIANTPDYDTYECDFYHAIGEYWMFRTSTHVDWVFGGLFTLMNVSQVRCDISETTQHLTSS
jgi:hypothetical protein